MATILTTSNSAEDESDSNLAVGLYCQSPEPTLGSISNSNPIPEQSVERNCTSSSVRVAVRIRPNSAGINGQNLIQSVNASSRIVPIDSSTISVVCPNTNSNSLLADQQLSTASVSAAADILWQYDSVWGEQADQESLYKHEVSPLVDAFVEGFNATLFAYGQTGSGKTFTMGTSVPDISSPAKRMSKLPSSGRSTPTPSLRHSTLSAPTTPSKSRIPNSSNLESFQKNSVSVSSLASAVSAISPHQESTMGSTSGMIPRAIHQIFNMIQSLRDKDQQSPLDSPTSSYTVKVSFLELHNEEWVDLLKEPSLAHTSSGLNSASGNRSSGVIGTFGKRPTTPSAKALKSALTIENEGISIREDKEGRISIHGATNVVVASPEAALALLAKGSKIRSTAATGMNETSSRSHAIFSLTLITTQVTNQQQQWSRSLQKQAGTGNTTSGLTISSKFHFVDLAGSERLKRTQNTGDRKAEGISINQGLLVLGRVINCLTDSKNTCADAVVPYRDSKLTRFLQDSLGGNSKTVMLACVSALETDLPETINTLRYASRARGIQNKSRITIDTSNSSAEVIPLLAEIASLKSLLAESTLGRANDAEMILSLQNSLETHEKKEQSELTLTKIIDRLSMEKRDMEIKFRDELCESRRERDELLTEISELKLNKSSADEAKESETCIIELQGKLKDAAESINDYRCKWEKEVVLTRALKNDYDALFERELKQQGAINDLLDHQAVLKNELTAQNERSRQISKTSHAGTNRMLALAITVDQLLRMNAHSQKVVSSLSTKCQNLESKQSLLDDSEKERAKFIKTLELDTANLNASVDTLTKENASRAHDLKIAEERKFDLESQIIDLRAESDGLKSRLECLQLLNEEHLNQIKRLESDLIRTAKSASEHLNELQQIKSKRENSRALENEASLKRVENAENKLQALKTASDDLKSQIIVLEKEKTDLSLSLSAANSECSKLNTLLSSANVENSALKSSHKFDQEALETKTATMVIQLENIQEQLEFVTSEKAEMSLKIQNLESEATNLKNKIATSQINIATLVQQVATFQAQVSLCSSTHENILAENKSNNVKLMETNSQLKSQLGTLQRTLDEKIDEISRIRMQIDQKEDLVKELELQNQKLGSIRLKETTSLKEMREMVDSLKKKLSEQETRTNAHVKQMEEKVHQYENVVDENGKLRESLKTILEKPENGTRKHRAPVAAAAENDDKQGHVISVADPNDDMFDRWCNYRSGNKSKTINRNHSSVSLVQRRLAEYGDLKMNTRGSTPDDADTQLADRYQFLLKTVKNVKELFDYQ